MNDSMWEVPIGWDADFFVDVQEADGDPIAFDGTEPLTCWLWQGDDLAPVPGVLTATWAGGDPTVGRFVASVSGTATAALASDYYLTRIAVLMPTMRLYNAYDGWLSLQDAPGAGVAPVVYCTLQDMLDVGGDWLATLMSTTEAHVVHRLTGPRASRQLDQAILSRFPTSGARGAGRKACSPSRGSAPSSPTPISRASWRAAGWCSIPKSPRRAPTWPRTTSASGS